MLGGNILNRKEITCTFSNEGTRNEVRMRVVSMFAEEIPGTGKDDLASRYIYYVETLSNGDRVYLQRPAFLHNGFDFLVCVENTNYAKPGERKRNYPKHDEFEEDLAKKRNENPEMFIKLHQVLRKIFDCHDVSDEEINEIKFNSGLPVDHIVKVTKWLFIEQDIRYWNYSGRNMTWGIVPEP